MQESLTNHGEMHRYYQVMFTFYDLEEVNSVTFLVNKERAKVANIFFISGR